MQRLMVGFPLRKEMFSYLTGTPAGERRTMKQPVRGDNLGKVGLVCCGDHIRSTQYFMAEILESGDLSCSNKLYQAAKFGIRGVSSSFRFKARDGSEMTDESSARWLGEELAETPGRMLQIKYGSEMIRSPKVIPLVYHPISPASPDYGFCAMMAYVVTDSSGHGNLYLRFMRDDTYEWSSNQMVLDFGSGASGGECSMVEMTDGTILVVFTPVGGITHLYRIFSINDDGAGNINANLVNLGDNNMVECRQPQLVRVGDNIILYYYNPADSYYLSAKISYDYGVTWSSSAVHIGEGDSSVGASNIDWCSISVAYGPNGEIFLFGNTNVSGLTMHPYIYKSTDGLSFSSQKGQVGFGFSGAIIREPSGIWYAYGALSYLAVSVGCWHSRCTLDDPTESGAWSAVNLLTASSYPHYFDEIGYYTSANEYMLPRLTSGALIGNGLFKEILHVFYHKVGAADYAASLVACRFGMWSGIQSRNVPAYSGGEYTYNWKTWSAGIYPSAAGGTNIAPYSKHWQADFPDIDTEATMQEGTLKLELGGDTGDQANYTVLFGDGTYDSGLTMRFCAKVGHRFFRTHLCISQTAGNREMAWMLEISTSDIKLYDMVSGTSWTFTPVNWSCMNYQDYMIIAHGKDIEVWRGTYDEYGELEVYEKLFAKTAVADKVYGAGEASIIWGIINGLAGTDDWDSRVYVKYFHYKKDNEYPWDDETDTVGKRCSVNPCGLLQGIEAKFAGGYALDEDAWVLETGFVRGAENIVVDSPSVGWKEADPEGESAETVFSLSAGVGETIFMDSVAFFGKNWELFKFEYYDDALLPPSWVTLIDTGTVGNGYWTHANKVGAETGQDFLEVDIGTFVGGGTLGQFPPDSFFRSDGNRNWFIRFTDGAGVNTIFRIKDNYLDESGHLYLVLEPNSDHFGAPGDHFNIFSDRAYYHFGSVYKARKIRLTVYETTTDDGVEDGQGLQLGTILVGRTYNLPDSEWGASITHTPNVVAVDGRTYRQYSEAGPKRRSVNLTYSGRVGFGMGTDDVIKTIEAARHGILPCVWVDDDTTMVDGQVGHHDPMLVRILGGVNVGHAAYFYNPTPWGVTRLAKRWVDNVDGFQLEEIL